ncbi:MAG: hypothetical protein AAFW65_08720 [Pseudomonadota bacterium]
MSEANIKKIKDQAMKAESVKKDKKIGGLFDQIAKEVKKGLEGYEAAFKKAQKAIDEKAKGSKDKKEKAELDKAKKELEADFEKRLKQGKAV